MVNLAQRTGRRLRDLTRSAIRRGAEIQAKSTRDDIATHGAALTYAAFLSLVPLIVLGLGITSQLAVLTDGQDAWFADLIQAIPGLEALIGGQQDALTSRAGALGIIGLAGVLWTASVLSGRAQHALSVIFGLPKRAVVNRLRALGVTMALGLALVLSIGAVGALRALDVSGPFNVPLQIATGLGSFAVAIAYFTTTYRLLTPAAALRFRDHLPGGTLMAAGWAGLAYVGAVIVARSIDRDAALYGTLATIFGLLLFIRMAMWLFLYGAELNALSAASRASEPAPREPTSASRATPDGTARS